MGSRCQEKPSEGTESRWGFLWPEPERGGFARLSFFGERVTR